MSKNISEMVTNEICSRINERIPNSKQLYRLMIIPIWNSIRDVTVHIDIYIKNSK